MSSKFTLPFFVAAALAVPALPSEAQTTKPAQQQNQTVPKPIQPGEPITGTEGSSGLAAAVGTETPTPEIQQHIQASGYTDPQLKPDSARGGWSGTAQKNGKQVELHVAPNGNISAR